MKMLLLGWLLKGQCEVTLLDRIIMMALFCGLALFTVAFAFAWLWLYNHLSRKPL